MNPESHSQAERRLQALTSYGILETPPEAVFDDLTRLAAQICHTPYALISLIDRDRLWFKSRFGFAAREIPSLRSFCLEATGETDVFVVSDAREDARFAESALLTEPPHFRFYAGAVLCAPEGVVIGTLCVLDEKPRTLSAEQLDALATLAKQVMAQLELRRALHSPRVTDAAVHQVGRALQEDAALLETLLKVGADLTAELDLERLLQKITDAATELTGARFGALFYNATRDEGEVYQLYILSGAPREAFERFPAPRKTAVFGPTFRGEGVVRSADILKDPRYGKSAPYHGLPKGHLPVRSYLAVPLVSRSGEVIGGLLFGHPEPGVFSDRAERLATGVASQAAIAIDNARLYQKAKADIVARERAEEALRESAAADAFRLTLADVIRPLGNPAEIQREAARVLGEHLRASRVHHTTISDDGEYAIVHSEYLNGVADIAGRYRFDDYASRARADLLAGRTLTINNLQEDSRLTAAERARIEALAIRAVVSIPLVKDGRLVTIFSVHHREPHVWTETEVALIEETAERSWAAVERALAEEGRRRVEEALRESTARLQFTLESAAVGDWDLDLTNDTSRRSLRHDQCFGYNEPIPDWGFETFIRHVHPEDREWVERAFRTAVVEHKDWRFECRVIWPDQSVHWIAAHGSIYYVDGKPNRMLGIVFDTTEQKHVEEALKSANARLIESDRRKDEFLAMLAHELRNPLGAIRNTVRLLERTVPDPQPQRYLEILERQSRTLAGLVDDLLEVSRVTRGLIELKRTRVDFAAVIERALESAQPLINEKRHEVSVTLPRKRVEVMGDALRLEQILVNLLINAAKYTDPGGRIDLRLETYSESVELRVRDTGIGMAAAIIERVFELFGQAERGLDRSQGGLGIGLTIVKSLVELHGGRIEAHSEGPGKGAEFVLLLPLAPVQEQALTPAAQESTDTANAKRVLLVDDNADAAETLALLLEMSGHHVAVAHDGPSALAKAEEMGPEVILLDIGLPGMDGYEVARQLRQNPRTQQIVLAALTGYGQPDDVERAQASGFDRHFVKPVEFDSLKAFVDNSRGVQHSPIN